MELEGAAKRSLHCERSLSMQRNKIYAITLISAIAAELGVDEDLLHKISIGMEPENGVIRVYGICDDAIMAFTDDGKEELKNFLEMYRRDPDLFP
jgi:hypothetical protein